MLQRIGSFLLAVWLAGAVPSLAQAARADRFDLSAYIQPQYERTDIPRDATRDRAFFRRMVVTLAGEPNEKWRGTVQFDLGPAASGDRLVVKDANLQYLGWRDRGITLTIGNQKPPFSRSLLTSASRRNAIERPFTGDRALGSPGRALGVLADGWTSSRHLRWEAEIASSLHSPHAGQIRVDGLTEAGADWNEGVLAAGRVEWHPAGEVAREQGALRSKGTRYVVAVAAYGWKNDGDHNLHTVDGRSTSPAQADASSVHAFEASAAMRSERLSVDAEFERVISNALDAAFSGGLYEGGRAEIAKASLEAGYMVVARTFELVGVMDAVDAGPYDHPWQRLAAGANWYIDGHNLKFQILHRVSRHVGGAAGVSGAATYLQAQIAF